MTNSGYAPKWDWKDKVPYYLLLVLCFFPIMPFGVMSVSIILFATGCIVANYTNFYSNLKRVGWKPFLVNTVFFLLLSLTIIYSENKENALIQIRKGLPLVLFPLIFFYFPPRIDRGRKHVIFLAFITSNFLFAAYVFQYLVNNASDFVVATTPGLVLFEGLRDQGFFTQLRSLWDGSFYETLYYARQTVESKLYIHKTYASQSILWCILAIIHFLFEKNLSVFSKVLSSIVMAILVLLLIYFYSLTNLLLFLVLVPGCLFFRIGSKKTRVAFASLVFLAGIGLFSFVNTTPKNIDRQTYEEYKRYEHPAYVFDNIARMFNNDGRKAINTCNVGLVVEAPWFGYGLGDVQDNLDLCYEELKKNGSYELDTFSQNLNPHNYYAFLWIAGGILVLVAFFFMLSFNFSIGWKKKDILYLALLLLVSLNLFAESTLSRAYGILFFALWNSLLLAVNIAHSENDRPK